MINKSHNVILFIPEAGIYSYLRGLSVLGDAIVKGGGKVFITHDTGQMIRSPLMDMYKIPAGASKSQKTPVYKTIEKYFKKVLKKYDFCSIELSDLVDKKLLKEVNILVDKHKGKLSDIKYHNFPVGKIAEYDFILETKFPYSSKLSSEHKKLYSEYVKNTALSLAITDKICDKYKPSLFITFNEYSQCQAVRYSAKIHDVRQMALTYPVHFNFDTSKFSIWKNCYESWIFKHIQNWKKWSNLPINSEYTKACWKDAVYRMYASGSHIFSNRKDNDPKNVFDLLNLDLKKKTIIVYTSSQDERKTFEISFKIWGEKNPVVDAFANQIEWLKMLKKYASSRNDIQVVVRIHPREGIRQNGVDSKHLQNLKSVFKKDSPNFTIVWPNDPISSYDLMELADVCLIAWSIMGQEAARVGIPVLSFSGNMYYPNDSFIQIATTKKEYRQKLDSMINIKYQWQDLTKAVRFYHWRTFIPGLNLNATVPENSYDDEIWPEAPSSMVKTINDILFGRKDLIKHNIINWQKSLPVNAEDSERKSMKWGIRYFMHFLFYPPPIPKKKTFAYFVMRKIFKNVFDYTPKASTQFQDYDLKYDENTMKISEYIKKTKINTNLRVLVADGSSAFLVNRGEVVRRMSPLVIRLAKLHEYV